MINKKQSSVEFIFNAFNLLSDADFKAWMLNNHDDIKAMHMREIVDSYVYGAAYNIDIKNGLSPINYYKEKFEK
jgi:hypothetical protein